MDLTYRRAALAAATLFGFVGLSGSALAAKPARAESGPLTAIHQFIDNFNKGDLAAAKAAYVDAPTIIDEPTPHIWSGPTAVGDWASALTADMKSGNDTDGHIRIGRTTLSHVEADKAYVHVDAEFLYRERRKAMDEHGGFSFALTKAGDDWKIAGWAWNGNQPVAVTTAPRLPATAPKAAPATKPRV